jgi:succinate dehydrogenase / fumarate reductase membrane anchor subunit
MNTATNNSRTGVLWLIKITTGVLLIVILAIHLTVNHMLGSANGLLTHSEVVAYYTNWIVPIMEIFFLVFVVTHSLLGVRNIYLDFNPSKRALQTANWVLVLFGAGFIIYGTWLIFQIIQFSA